MAARDVTQMQAGHRKPRTRTTAAHAESCCGLGTAGIEPKDLRLHDLRHTFASQWMMNGGNLYVLKEILGHKTVQMTARYARLSQEFKRAAVNRLDNVWKKDQSSPQASNSPVQTPPVTRSHRLRFSVLRLAQTQPVVRLSYANLATCLTVKQYKSNGLSL